MVRCLYLIIVVLFSCTGNKQTIKIKGSDTEVNLVVHLAESFHKKNPDIFISISGGGSGLGIASLMNGTGDIANSSRNINPEEMKLFHEKNIQVDSSVFAQDAIAFIVSKDLPLDSIDINQLSRVLNGSQRNWKELTGKDVSINIYGRQTNSGTHEFICKKLNISFSPYAKQMNGNAQIVEAVSVDPSGIGYVGAGYVRYGGNKGIKALLIYDEKSNRALSPLDIEMISSGSYYFQRPLFHYYRADAYEYIRPFLDYEKTEAAQKIISSAGYYAIK